MMTGRGALMASASSLVVNRAVLPSAFPPGPIGDFGRGLMFGWDERPAREFDGLRSTLIWDVPGNSAARGAW